MTARLRPYPVYKSSSVPWLGRIPEDWAIKPLKRCAAINQATLTETTDPDFAFQYVDIGAVGEGRMVAKPQRLSFAAAPSRARRVVRPGDTMISTVRTYLKAVCHVASCDEPTVASTGFAVLTPSDMMVPRFLFYSVLSEHFIRRVSANSVGASYPAIEPSRLGCLPIAVPSDLAEQVQISSFLDVSLAAIGRLIRAKRRQIELLNEQKQSIINKAVTREMGSVVWLKQSGVEWLGEMPSEWRLVRLKTIGRIRYGLSQPPKESSTGIPFVRATNIKRGKIVDKGMLYVSPEDLPQGRDPILKRHEIIVVRSGAYTADSAIVPDAYAGAIAGYDMVVSVRNANPRFVALALLSNYVLNDQLALVRTRAAQPHLNAEDLGDTLIMLPPEGEQELIADAVQLKINGLDQIITATLHQIACLREYRTRLIADVVTGKLDVRGVELPDLEGIDVADDFGGSDFDSDADQDDLPDAQEVEADGED